MPMYDAQGNELISALPGAAGGVTVKPLTPGGSRRAVGGAYARHFVRAWRLLQVAANTVPAPGAETFSSPIYVSDAVELLVLCLILSGTGTPATPKCLVQVGELNNNVFGTHPQGAINGAGTLTGSNMWGIGQLSNFGSVIRVGLSAGTAWTGGTVEIWAYAKA